MSKIFKPEEAKEMITEKVDEINDIFTRIDHPGRLALSVLLFDDYKAFSVYNRDDISGGDIIHAYELRNEGLGNWGK